MKIAIVGAGSVGSLFGTLLAASGEDVTMVRRRQDVIDLIQKEGMTVDIAKTGETVHSRPKMVNAKDIASIGICDLVVICTKGFDTRAAMENAKPIIGKDTYIMSNQNGWGNVEEIKEVLGGDDSHIIAGVLLSVVSPKEGKPNHLVWVFGTDVIKAGPVNRKITPEIENIAETFRKAKLDFTIAENYIDVIWNKLVGNTAMPIAAVLGMTNDEYMAYENTRQLVTNMFNESIAVATAMGVKHDNPDDPIQPHHQILKNFMAYGKGKGPKGSMSVDIENGRKTEIDTINGAIVREGKRLGIPTPINETFVLLIKAMEERNAAGKIYNYDRK